MKIGSSSFKLLYIDQYSQSRLIIPRIDESKKLTEFNKDTTINKKESFNFIE